MKSFVILLAIVTSLLSCTPAVNQHRNPETGLLDWTISTNGLSFQLIQLNPDYVAAFYESRNLPKKMINHMADQCVFGTIVRNESGQTLTYRVADWRYITGDGKNRPVKTKTQWVNEWKSMGVPYGWSILPDEQRFEPDDWSQGFTALPLPHGTRFDLVYYWRIAGRTYHVKLEDLHCAPAELPAS